MSSPLIRELASGAVLLALGGFFAFTGQGLPMTESGAMGAGYFPRVLAWLLVLLGLAVMAVAWLGRAASAAAQPSPVLPVPWRALVMICLALVWFALSVRPLGLGLALGGAVALSCAASAQSTLRGSLLLTAGVVVFAWLVFVVALKMPVPMLGNWLR